MQCESIPKDVCEVFDGMEEFRQTEKADKIESHKAHVLEH